MTTINTRDPGWDAIFAGRGERGPAHVLRSTTSSRRPGKAIEGIVVSRGAGRALCPACGGYRFASDTPHAPRWRGNIQVDCAGREVRR